ncbi:hypothetical protein AMTRI_Chr05g63710 [Amborella trichopoda]
MKKHCAVKAGLQKTEGMNRDVGSSDFISNLPDCILSCITGRLSMKDAVRTSVLSKKWKYVWTSATGLDMNEDCFCLNNQNGWRNERRISTEDKRKKMVKAVSHVFNSHIGHIEKFQLLFNPGIYTSHVDQWISFLTCSGAQEVDLDFRFQLKKFVVNFYRLPSYFFDCESLRVLTLQNCLIQLPVDFKGFKSLAVLVLSGVYIQGSHLEGLVSKCERLQSLTLQNAWGFKFIKIRSPLKSLQCLTIDNNCRVSLCEVLVDAPNLLSLNVTGYMSNHFNVHALVFNFPRLVNFSCTCVSHSPFTLDGEQADVLVMVLKKLAYVENMSLLGSFIKLCIGRSNFPVFGNLRKLSIKVDMTQPLEVTEFTCFLKSCPSLKELVIWCDEPLGKKYSSGLWENVEPTDCIIHHLERVVINDFSGEEDGMGFMNFLLKNARVLKKITVNFNKGLWKDTQELALRGLKRLERADGHVELLIGYVSFWDDYILIRKCAGSTCTS